MPRPLLVAEDPRTEPATAETVYDRMRLTGLRLNRGRLLVTFTRTDATGVADPEDDGFDIVFKDFDTDLARAGNAEVAWDGMLRALAALYRERRLIEKISRRSDLGLDTSALEAKLASVRTLLGIT